MNEEAGVVWVCQLHCGCEYRAFSLWFLIVDFMWVEVVRCSI